MNKNRSIIRLGYRKIREHVSIDGAHYVYDYDLGRHLTQQEIENGVVFIYDLELQEEANYFAKKMHNL